MISQSLFLKGELKLKDAECRLEGSGGVMYDLLSKMVGNPNKIPRVPSSKTLTPWEGHGFFYVKPAMVRLKKPGKIYFFVSNLKDRDAWIDSVRQTIVALENLRLSAVHGKSVPDNDMAVQSTQERVPRFLAPTVGTSGPPLPTTASASPGPESREAPALVSVVRSSDEMSPVIQDSYMQARAQFGPASSSSHTAFATLRSTGRNMSDKDVDSSSTVASTFSGALDSLSHQGPAVVAPSSEQTDIQKAQLNSFFQSPSRKVVRNAEKITAVSLMNQSQLDSFVSSLGFPSIPPYLQGISGSSLLDISIEELVELGVDLDQGKRLRSAFRDYLSV